VKSTASASAVVRAGTEHFKQFCRVRKCEHVITNHEIFLKLRAVLEAAKEDYEGGI